ncbi:hypothetical protein Y032_0766g2176 [Ancylostoma ceylanicum]|uniref:Uncharacterized protein n=1 Tax=Ancylostoma ceylanicum TaxID=53326 RepID=A0A016WDV3_9BILA|nr:hypothetical protein Y032_0766g2176 [Ancylostoma ceylanicum]
MGPKYMIGGLSYTRKRSRRARLRNSWNFARGHHLNSSFKVLQFYFSILKHLPHYTLKNGGPLFQGKDDRFTLIGIDSGHVGNAEEGPALNFDNYAGKRFTTYHMPEEFCGMGAIFPSFSSSC